ncbi:hypothetical protein SLE2022_147700 [Rubroshorea leprosula]
MEPPTSSSTTEQGVGTNNEPKYKGVRKRKWGKWVSEIRLPNSRERIWLGSYDSAEKAARAFDAANFCLRGRNAKFNFPQNPPEIAGGRSMSAQEIQEAAARFANEEVPRRSSNLSNSHNAAAPEQNSSSTPSSVVSDGAVAQVDTEVMDWSFLNMLDCNEGVSSYGLYDGLLGYMPGELYAPPSHQPLFDDNLDDQTGEETAFSSHSSFLWNF